MSEEVIEVKAPVYVLLVNEMDKEFVDKCGGKVVKIPPHKAARVRDYVAYHLIGDPRILNGEDVNAAAAEQKRVWMRYAAFKPEQRDEKVPKLRIEAAEEEEIKIVDAPEKKKAEESEDFPALKRGKKG